MAASWRTSTALRVVAMAFGGTSAVIVLPAPIIAPAPIVTGATSAVFDPIDAPSPIRVLNLPKPS